MSIFGEIGQGFAVATSWQNLTFCFGGVALGTVVGVLPGLPPITTIAILLPITFYLEPTSALIMLAGIYYGAQFGGSQTAILLNLPGTTSHAVTALEGYELTKRGKAGTAVVMATLASFFGGCIATIVVMTLAPALSRMALQFGPAEYFALIILGLIAASALSHGSFFKGLCMVVLGLLLGLTGIDVNSGQIRFSFGQSGLVDGINFVALAMGLFGVTEIIQRLCSAANCEGSVSQVRARDLVPSARQLRENVTPMMRGSVIGSILGIVPGAGPTVSAFVSYAAEKKLARGGTPFGEGALAGVTGPESSNNAAAQTSFIPTLTLGLPGDVTMALMLGALMIHGVTPGPHMIAEHPTLFWALIASMWLGNLMLLFLNLPLVGLWVRLLSVPYQYLYPTVLMFIAVGVYSIGNSTFDVMLTAIFGFMGLVLSRLQFEPAPLLLGFILGPLLEENMRRALLISHGDPLVFIDQPISAGLLALAFVVIGWSVVTALGRRAFRGPVAAKSTRRRTHD